MDDFDVITCHLVVVVCIPESVSDDGVPVMDPPPERLMTPMTMHCYRSDPFMVEMNLHAPTEVGWRFARDFLRDAMTKHVVNDGIHAGPVDTPDGKFTSLGTVPWRTADEKVKAAVVYASNEPLTAFLDSTYNSYPAGEEMAGVDMDAELANLLK